MKLPLLTLLSCLRLQLGAANNLFAVRSDAVAALLLHHFIAVESPEKALCRYVEDGSSANGCTTWTERQRARQKKMIEKKIIVGKETKDSDLTSLASLAEMHVSSAV
jgi:hypothetical protein